MAPSEASNVAKRAASCRRPAQWRRAACDTRAVTSATRPSDSRYSQILPRRTPPQRKTSSANQPAPAGRFKRSSFSHRVSVIAAGGTRGARRRSPGAIERKNRPSALIRSAAAYRTLQSRRFATKAAPAARVIRAAAAQRPARDPEARDRQPKTKATTASSQGSAPNRSLTVFATGTIGPTRRRWRRPRGPRARGAPPHEPRDPDYQRREQDRSGRAEIPDKSPDQPAREARSQSRKLPGTIGEIVASEQGPEHRPPPGEIGDQRQRVRPQVARPRARVTLLKEEEQDDQRDVDLLLEHRQEVEERRQHLEGRTPPPRGLDRERDGERRAGEALDVVPEHEGDRPGGARNSEQEEKRRCEGQRTGEPEAQRPVESDRGQDEGEELMDVERRGLETEERQVGVVGEELQWREHPKGQPAPDLRREGGGERRVREEKMGVEKVVVGPPEPHRCAVENADRCGQSGGRQTIQECEAAARNLCRAGAIPRHEATPNLELSARELVGRGERT